MKLYRAFLALMLAMVAAVIPKLAAHAESAPEGLADGPGIWVNIWNYPDGDIESYCQGLHAKGIRNLFVQTSRSNTDAIAHPEQLAALIESSHRYKIRVIAWSFAELYNPVADADKLIAAAKFTTPRGQHLDAIAANMEKDLSSAKVEPYSKHLRDVLGPTYPMVAVVYSPLNKAPQVARIPWKMLDRYYTVLAPMNYWNSKYKKLDPYAYTIATIQKVRELVGRPDVEIHVIGDGMGTHSDSISQFFRACQVAGATSASLYPNYKATDEQLDCISHYSEFFPVNSRFRLAAFHQAVKTGSLDSNGNDPASSISRGEFYKLVVKQLGLAAQFGIDARSLTSDKAADLLHALGALLMAHVQFPRYMTSEQVLAAPVGSREAFNVVAAVLSIKSNPHAAVSVSNAKSNRPDRWFVQPVFAETDSDAASKPLSFLDAAQIVLQASSGLRG